MFLESVSISSSARYLSDLPATCDHSYSTNIELYEVGDFARGQIKFHRIVNSDERIWKSNSACIVGH